MNRKIIWTDLLRTAWNRKRNQKCADFGCAFYIQVKRMQRSCSYASFTELEIVKDTHLCYIDFMMKEMRDKMALINNLKRIRHLPNNVLASFRMIGDSRISTLQKAAFIGLAGGYLLWPNDLIIDIPWSVGWHGCFSDFIWLVYVEGSGGYSSRTRLERY